MKKIIAVLIVFCITASLFALEEVRGVQTRKIKDGEHYDFEFTNENDFPVSVEVELYYGNNSYEGCRGIGVRNTKSFNLAARESYVWETKIHPNFACNGYVKYKAWKSDTGKKSKSQKNKKLIEEDDDEEYDEEDSENAGFAVSVAPRQKRRTDRERRLDKEEEEAEIARLEVERRRRDRERERERGKRNSDKLKKGIELVLEMCSEGKYNKAVKAIEKLSEIECNCEEDEKVLELKKELFKNGCPQ